MSRLTDLIATAKAKDPQLGNDLEREFKTLSSRLPFGLNFERHRPEVVELPLRPIRKGDKVRVLPERGSKEAGDKRLWQIKSISGKGKAKVAELELLYCKEPDTQSVPLDDLVVVAEFRDVIYPGLVSTGKGERGGDKPFHTVINGENYHALEMLLYAYEGKVDCIYIDPPYNTGAKDWKYNNDYVAADDAHIGGPALHVRRHVAGTGRDVRRPTGHIDDQPAPGITQRGDGEADGVEHLQGVPEEGAQRHAHPQVHGPAPRSSTSDRVPEITSRTIQPSPSRRTT